MIGNVILSSFCDQFLWPFVLSIMIPATALSIVGVFVIPYDAR